MTTTPSLPSSGSDHAALAEHRQQAVRLLKALANEHRLNILCCLREGEVSVGELARRLPLSQSALSQHLAWLRSEHLVATRRHAQKPFFTNCAMTKPNVLLPVLNNLYCGINRDGAPHAAD